MRFDLKHFAATLSLTVTVSAGIPVVAHAQALAAQPLTSPFAPASNIEARSAFKDLFADTIADFTQVPSKKNLTILAIGGVAAALGHPADNQVSQTLVGSKGLGTVLSGGNTMGSAAIQMAAAMATYTIGRSTSNVKVRMLGADLFRAQIVAQALTQGIKFSVDRTRPDGTAYSFPSGHTASAFATAAVLERNLGWKAGVPAYAAAAYVAASRVQDQRHYLSDVAFGAAIGIVAGRAVTIGRGDARFAVSPAPTAGGAAVNFTLIGKN
jgi:membrane-associated phospholipid phosphatase